MVRPDTVLKSVKTALKQSNRLPSATSYATFELDTEGMQSNVRPPVVELTIIDNVRSKPHNTDFAGYATDNSGNEIGRIYDALFEMQVQIDVWTAEGGEYSAHEIGEEIRYALYQYDIHQKFDPLPDPNNPSQSLGQIDYFSIDDGQTENDLSMTPALRRWRQTADVWFRERVNTADEYGSEDFIVDVITPGDGDMEGGTGAFIVFDATPNTDSTADDYT